ncbi:MAG: glutamate-1-semialdehyde 2,1-aminomutase [Deltaproteobacteria bacterium]|nr:glutamate-1-semialdehyde 2,1-aminomutase [Deltaproteobacteria bacterium]
METQSGTLFQQARDLIPGGVNSPVRACKAVGLDPPFIERAEGCFLVDVDGRRYIDYVCSWGPMILGHAHPAVIRAVERAAEKGTSYGAPTELEVAVADLIVRMVPSIEMVRMVNSGTEAAMSAVRLARGFTDRPKIIKFEGCYHGHADSLLVSAGSGVATLGIPGSPGIPEDIARHTISLPFNDKEAVTAAFDRWGPQIAAVIVEPIPANMGVVLPREGFLPFLREITRTHDALLIFDEVITGFRVGAGGAQELYGILPDLTCLGKIIGGGLPVGAYGGRREIMSRMAPEGNIYQAGTLSGNPLAMAAGLETLKRLQEPSVYDLLEKKGQMLFDGLRDAAKAAGLPVTVNAVGSLGSLFFTEGPVTDFASATAAAGERFTAFYRSMLERGVYLAPSPFEAWFVSLAHDEPEIRRTLGCAQEALRSMA